MEVVAHILKPHCQHRNRMGGCDIKSQCLIPLPDKDQYFISAFDFCCELPSLFGI